MEGRRIGPARIRANRGPGLDRAMLLSRLTAQPTTAFQGIETSNPQSARFIARQLLEAASGHYRWRSPSDHPVTGHQTIPGLQSQHR